MDPGYPRINYTDFPGVGSKVDTEPLNIMVRNCILFLECGKG